MNKKIKSAFLAVITFALVASGALASPAKAVSPLTVTVSKTSDLALAGEIVTVSITGIPSGPPAQGVYVYQCASAVASPRPDATKCRSSMSDSLWLTTAGGMGAGVASEQNPLTIVKEFTIGSTAFDCSEVDCGIFVRRDHMGPSDFNLDTIIPISFATNEEVVIPNTPGNQAAETGNQTPKLNKKFSREISFSSGSSKLDSTNKSKIKNKIKDFRLASKITITASAGMTLGTSENATKALAKKRANAIRKYLVAQGISADKIVIKAKIAKPGKKPSTKVVATP